MLHTVAGRVEINVGGSFFCVAGKVGNLFRSFGWLDGVLKVASSCCEMPEMHERKTGVVFPLVTRKPW